MKSEWNWRVDIILQWTLGWGLRKDVLLPPPDFLAGIVVCAWVVWLYCYQRRMRTAAAEGDTKAAGRVILQAFIPLVVSVAVGMAAGAVLSGLLSGLEDDVTSSPLPALVAISFLRTLCMETVTQGFAIAFTFRGFKKDYLKKSLLWALVWSVPYSAADAVMFSYYNKSDSVVPRIFAIASSGVMFLVYLVVVIVMRKGRPALRHFALFTLLWRAVQISGICLSFLEDSSPADTIFDVCFIVIQGLGLPLAMHLTIFQDTHNWRRLGSATSGDGHEWLATCACCCGGLSVWAFIIPPVKWYDANIPQSVSAHAATEESKLTDDARTPLRTYDAAATEVDDRSVTSARSRRRGSSYAPSPFLADFNLDTDADEDYNTEMSEEQGLAVGRQFRNTLKHGLGELSMSDLTIAARTARVPMLDFAFIKLGRHLYTSGMAYVLEATYAAPTVSMVPKVRKVAVKVLTPPNMTAEYIQKAVQEASTCYTLRHKNIVEFIGICVCPPSLSFVFEFCKLGDLRILLNKIVMNRHRFGVEEETRMYDRHEFYPPPSIHSPPAAAKQRQQSQNSLSSDTDTLTEGDDDVKRIMTSAVEALTHRIHTLDVEDVRRASLRESAEARDRASASAATIPWKLRIRLAHEIASAVEYIHSFDPAILHRDIKSKNILVAEGNVMKLSDFGEAKRLGSEAATELRGTAAWMAPEVMTGNQYSAAADIYSLTVVLWELLCYQAPFEGYKSEEVIHRVSVLDERPGIPRSTPASYAALLQLGWHSDPAKRPGIKEIVALLEKMMATLHAVSA